MKTHFFRREFVVVISGYQIGLLHGVLLLFTLPDSNSSKITGVCLPGTDTFFLFRNAQDIAIRTEDAAVTRRRLDGHVAVSTAMGNEAEIGRNFQLFPKTAKGAGKVGVANEFVFHDGILCV
jgi:hypothetical protein